MHDTPGPPSEAAVEEHAAIYAAIRDGRPEAAADTTAAHLDRTLEDDRQ
ncbi:FCD domain-containing protein [Streptomyces sp. NPDC057253]